MSLVVLTDTDYHTLGEAEFGIKGLTAVESIGPFVRVQASGPLIMVHDGRFEPRHGIGHHPHRFNERLFYILEGAVDHDDALNDIQGHMGPGDLGRLTEGVRGMLHKEWNETDDRGRAYILVYQTDPVPPLASFGVLRDADAPRYDEGPGVGTKELVGPRSGLEVNGDIRLFTDSELDAGAELELRLDSGEGGLLFPLSGGVEVANGETAKLGTEETALIPPEEGQRSYRVRATEDTRLIRVVHGSGNGFVVR